MDDVSFVFNWSFAIVIVIVFTYFILLKVLERAGIETWARLNFLSVAITAIGAFVAIADLMISDLKSANDKNKSEIQFLISDLNALVAFQLFRCAASGIQFRNAEDDKCTNDLCHQTKVAEAVSDVLAKQILEEDSKPSQENRCKMAHLLSEEFELDSVRYVAELVNAHYENDHSFVKNNTLNAALTRGYRYWYSIFDKLNSIRNYRKPSETLYPEISRLDPLIAKAKYISAFLIAVGVGMSLAKAKYDQSAQR